MTEIGKLPLRYRLPRRLVQLHLGLLLYGMSMAFMIQARLGSMPWDVLHQGATRRTGLPFGWVVVALSGVVLLLWVPLRQRPGVGTVCNALLVGPIADRTLAVLPAPHPLAARIAFLVFGIGLNGVASALYLGATLGPGPRDGLMTGLVARTGRSIRLVRTAIEVAVVLSGWLLGGVFGVGTLAYAFAIGPLVHLLLPRLIVRQESRTPHAVSGSPHGLGDRIDGGVDIVEDPAARVREQLGLDQAGDPVPAPVGDHDHRPALAPCGVERSGHPVSGPVGEAA
jgi:uncharacterized membrane protein YczE